MRLRYKLLLMALFAALFPAAGWRFIAQMEDTLRHSEEAALTSQSQLIADAIVQLQPKLMAPLASADRIILQPLETELTVDGYVDDWGKLVLAPQRFESRNKTLPIDFIAAQSPTATYLWLSIGDLTPVWADGFSIFPERSDHILFSVAGARYRLACTSAGPSTVTALTEGASPLPPAACQARSRGYFAELKIPRTGVLSSLGLKVHDFPVAGADLPQARAGTLDERLQLREWPTVQSAELTRALAALVPNGMRMRVLDRQGRVVVRAGALATTTQEQSELSFRRWLRAWVYRMLLAPKLDGADAYRFDAFQLDSSLISSALDGQAGARWRASGSRATVVLASAVPIHPQLDGVGVSPSTLATSAAPAQGVLLLEKTSDALLIWSNRALGSLLLGGMAMMLIAASALFGYAGWLSYRVRRLKTAAENALTPEGRLKGNFPKSRTIDEVGDLSRSFATLLEQLGEYTDYLRTLSSKLSHELSTPLAVVRSSLENLEHEGVSASARTYIERARSGAERLTQLLRSMSEATRLERAIASAESESFDLCEVVRGAAAAYRDLASGHEIICECPKHAVIMDGAPELIHQALDKLVDNALGFAPTQSRIVIRLSLALDAPPALAEKFISVSNMGAALPEKMRARLFDSLVSLREPRAGQTHLGLGLYIVRLIAERHGGKVMAEDLLSDTGQAVGAVVGFSCISFHAKAAASKREK
jgi:two-component system, OmpR family, sensor histidine kinase ChvG